MRKLSYVLAALLCIAGCSKSAGDFKGKEYSMINPQNGVEITLGFDRQQNQVWPRRFNDDDGPGERNGSRTKLPADFAAGRQLAYVGKQLGSGNQ